MMAPDNPRPAHWAAFGEATFVLGIRALYWIWRVLGRTPFRLVLYPVVLWYWATRRVARRASADYLRRVYAASGRPSPTWRDGVRHFVSFGETILDKLIAYTGRYPYERIEFEGVNTMIDQIASGRGGIIVTAHVGCLELCQAASRKRPGFRLTVLVHTRHAERFNRLLRRLSADAPVRLVEVTELTPALLASLDERVHAGEFLAIAGDRIPVDAGGRVIRVPFFGSEAAFPVGAYALAGILHAEVFTLTCHRQGSGRHRLIFSRHADFRTVPRQLRQTLVADCVAAFAGRLETTLSEAPFEWFNFFPFWEDQAGAPTSRQPTSVSHPEPPARHPARASRATGEP